MKRFGFILGILLVGLTECAYAETLQITGVPFKSQSPPGNWTDNLNCGPTAAMMLAGYYQEEIPTTEDLMNLLDWLYLEKYISPQVGAEYYDGNATSVTDLKNILEYYFHLGTPIITRKNDFEFLAKELARHNPIIVGVNIRMNPASLGHFMVLTGLTETQVTVHDPGLTAGADDVYSRDQFISSWRTSGFASLVIKRSASTWHPDGTLVKAVGENEVFQILSGQLHWLENEDVFKAHDFHWDQVIPIQPSELDCYTAGFDIDWQPERQLFLVSGQYYLIESNTAGASCVSYRFASDFSFQSWQIDGEVISLSMSEFNAVAEACASGGILYVRHGTLIKPDSVIAGFGSGVIFLAMPNGQLRPFDSLSAFNGLGFDYLPLNIVEEDELYDSSTSFGQEIFLTDTARCLRSELVSAGSNDEVAESDVDADGFSIEAGDCNDSDFLFHPEAPEDCDGLDTNCDGQTDDDLVRTCSTSCGTGQAHCVSGHWFGCVIEVFVPEEEDGFDNDCDGLIDEGFTIPEDTSPLDVDNDHDGLTPRGGDCDDWSPTVNSSAPEICDALDNDCDWLVDEDCPASADGGADLFPPPVSTEDESTGSSEVDDIPHEDPDVSSSDSSVSTADPDESGGFDLSLAPDSSEGSLNPSESTDSIMCSITCEPDFMVAYAWYGSSGVVSGQTAVVNITKETLCERGHPWFDFNCTCPEPYLWECYDWPAARISCNQEFEMSSGIVDYSGEGEVWFDESFCY